MKMKNLIWMYIVILSLGTILSLYIPKQETAANELTVIPNDAIRLRILANSDLEKDQQVKRLIRDEVNAEITSWVQNLTSKEEARNTIKSRLPELQIIAENIMEEQKLNQDVTVDFGNVEFPTKLYGQFLYPAGEYDAVLITLGKGEGANWWCVLYPPLCFLDFSNGNAVRSPGFEDRVEASELDHTQVEQTEKVEENQEVVKVEAQTKTQVEKKATPKQSTKSGYTVDKTKKEEQLLKEMKTQTKSVKAETIEPIYVEEKEEEPEVRFFVVDMMKSLFN